MLLAAPALHVATVMDAACEMEPDALTVVLHAAWDERSAQPEDLHHLDAITVTICRTAHLSFDQLLDHA